MVTQLERVYKVELITPLIMAGVYSKKPEIRTQSIKGALRWWYRFWKAPEAENLEELKESEGEIFGSTDRASRVRIEIAKEQKGPWGAVLKLGEGETCYLCMNDRRSKEDGAPKPYNKMTRLGFQRGHFFMRVRATDGSVLNDVEKTLSYLSSLGGLGARWRRGFGSVRVLRVEESGETPLEVKLKFKSVKDKRLLAFPNLGSVRIWEVKPNGDPWSDWEKAMDDLRDKLYRKFKGDIGCNYLGNPSKERFASPLIISIKKGQSSYYGVIMLHDTSEFWRRVRLRVAPQRVSKVLSDIIENIGR